METLTIDALISTREKNPPEDVARQLEQIEVLRLCGDEAREVEAIFAGLPRDILCGSTELCYRMVLLQNMKGDLQAAHKWLTILTGLRDTIREDSPGRQMLENRISCATLSLPEGPNSNLLLSFAVLSSEFANVRFPLARLSATGGFPSVLRGAKDLSGLGKHYRASASIVRPLLPSFLEDDGNGVCETAIAELLYEQNDLNGASLQAAAAISADNPEIAFAALSVLARLGAVDTTAKPPSEILAYIGEILEKKNARWLNDNYNALKTRFDILDGNVEKTREWLASCRLNDLDGYSPRDSYVMLTKAKAYIALGEYRNAVTLLESLALSMQKARRPLDTVECLVNQAVACELLGSEDVAVDKLEQALLLAQEYGYVRVFADCGKRLFHLMARFGKDDRPGDGLSGRYIRKITEAAKIFSMLHPALYASGGEKKDGAEEQDSGFGGLTQNELQVLQLLDDGKTNKQIASAMHITANTVKFHLSNVFEKLGASNRVEAIKAARNKGILS